MDGTPKLHLISSFEAFVTSGSMDRAAKALALTQPTVSRHITELQSYFDQPLLRLEGRKLVLTELGQSLFSISSIHLKGLRKSIHNLSIQASKPSNISLRVGARREVLKRFITDLKFEGRLITSTVEGKNAEALVHSSAVDILVSNRDISTGEYIRRPLFKDGPVLIVPKTKSSTPLETWDFKKQSLSFANYSGESNYLESYCKVYCSEYPNIDFDSSDWEFVEERVHSGLSWSIIPSSFIKKKRNYKSMKLNLPNSESQFYIYYLKSLHNLVWFKGLREQITKIFR